MSDRSQGMSMAGPGAMLLSAVIFGYFGFSTSWNYNSVITGQFLFFVALLDWTLKGAAIGFGASAVITFMNPLAGNLLYCMISILSAIAFVIVAILDLIDTQHTAMSPVLLLLFAAWNGYGSWSGLKELLALRAAMPRNETFAPPS